MHNEHSHPLLQQTPLSVNPFIDLPRPPPLPPTYTTLPSTLPPSTTHAPPTSTHPDLPAYVTASSGFAAHPSTITAQNRALLTQLESAGKQAEQQVREWEEGIKERELAEKRRKAPGWLDSEMHLLQPAKNGESGERAGEGERSLIDEPESELRGSGGAEMQGRDAEVEDLGRAMDRAFG